MTYADVTSAEVLALRTEVARLRKENAILTETVEKALKAASTLLDAKKTEVLVVHPDQMSLFSEDGGVQ